FMIGLPSETDADVQAIVELARQVKNEAKQARGNGEVNVAVSSFVPKAHTPFQWEPQISYEEILTKQDYLRQELKRRKLNFKWQDAPLSVLEGVFARGDRRLGRVLLKARELGCRFDGWGEHFKFALWLKAFAEVGLDPRWYHRRRELDEVLPWSHLDCGVTTQYLLLERNLAFQEGATPDCRTGRCTGCGVCDFREVKRRVFHPIATAMPAVAGTPSAGDDPGAQKIRARFSKTGRLRFLSHLELITLFTRAVSRGGIPVRYSQGFHPHPRFSFATALSVGVESHAEYLDLEVAAGFSPDELLGRLNGVLPEGMRILEAWLLPPKSPSLTSIMERVRYRVTLPEILAADLNAAAGRFLALAEYPYRREKKGQEFDLRHELFGLTVAGSALELEIGRGKPLEFVAAILGCEPAALADCPIEKLAVIFRAGDEQAAEKSA
ncbi:MAG TPA: TIGR03936 family radical SAM-associated protein, partial [Desulfurivibrionaceae bacterium]|nr:TIGR03936 family radical SAM-associated protein [Desulfurivibrionaceae bacterium]